MPVIALGARNTPIDILPTTLSSPTRQDSPTSMLPEEDTGSLLLHKSNNSIDSGVAFPPRPIVSPNSAGETIELSSPPALTSASTAATESSLLQTDQHGSNQSRASSQPPRSSPPMSEHQHDIQDHSDPEAGPSGPRQIPPIPNPRRHRSGVYMSRVRNHSGGNMFKSGLVMTASKSFGDLSGIGGLMMSAMPPIDSQKFEKRETTFGKEGKRVLSEGSRRGSEEVEETMWDNSARFYQHMHSRPPSRPVSRTPSPSSSPKRLPGEGSPGTSPIYVRRSMTLPQNGLGPPGSLPQPATGPSAMLSPNHQFLQNHLPPTFPQSVQSSPEASLIAPHPMVILTPTTAEWKELKREYKEIEGDLQEDGSSDDSRRSSVASSTDRIHEGSISALQLDGIESKKLPKKPSLIGSVSAEVLGAEHMHSPDPGSMVVTPPQEDSPDLTSPPRPVFKPNIIAPSPVMPTSEAVPIFPGALKTISPVPLEESNLEDKQFGWTLEEFPGSGSEGQISDGSPVRFASIGRTQSLRVIKKADGDTPKKKTKRELEREKLFRDLDEELLAEKEAEPGMLQRWNSVTEIGAASGLGLESSLGSARSSSEIASSDRTELHPGPGDRSVSAPQPIRASTDSSLPRSQPISLNDDDTSPIHSALTKVLSISPTQPLKPSPLQSSPVNAISNVSMPTSENSPSGTSSQVTSPNPHTANLDTIRDFAKSLVTPHHGRESSRTKEKESPIENTTPAAGRKRDMKRVSLVAGKVIQPFSVPSNTALPPQSIDKSTTSLNKKASLQSFSPFRSPSLAPARSRTPPLPPFNRFDSNISIAPSIDAPSPVGTPISETAGGVGGRGIEDYVILKEAGKGAYGLVMRAKVKGPKGEPVGEEVIIKYIVKARILADCWKKHKVLGPIPVEIHVMDQIRHLMYHPPARPHPWDPARYRQGEGSPATSLKSDGSNNGSPDSTRPPSSLGMFSPTQKYIHSELKVSPERGHPNICKLLDFFEDKEFYYMVMPRFGTGLDLFDRVEAVPNGLDPFDIRSLIGQLADAVRFLHANGIVHRDIKDENVILDGSGRCQLIDFGSAAHWRPGKRWDTFSGTLHYASPEILRGEMYGGKEQDVYALGTVMYVLLVGETPFGVLPDEVLEGLKPGTSAEEALEERCGGDHSEEGKEPDGGGRLSDAADLVRRCLEMEVGDRPTAEMVCQHRFIRGEGGWTGPKGWVKPRIGKDV